MNDDMKWQDVNTGDEPSCFIQWKGTDVCVDLHCPCGTSYHYDGICLYAWKCIDCDSYWQMGSEVRMREGDDSLTCVQVMDEESKF